MARRRNISLAVHRKLDPALVAELNDARDALGALPDLLTDSETQRLFQIVRGGTEEEQSQALQTLCLHNLRIVVAAAEAFVGRGAPAADLIQEGVVGLRRGLEGYDTNRRNPKTGQPYHPSTYYGWWIRQAMERITSKPSPRFHHAMASGWNGSSPLDDLMSHTDSHEIDEILVEVRRLPPPADVILCATFGLDGQPPRTVNVLAKQINILPSEINRILGGSLALIRHRINNTENQENHA